MLIDWFTVVAQIVNFLILVALLKRFLYGPLIRAIDARENGIAAQIAQADQKNREAAELMAQARAQRDELEQKRQQTIAEAREDADRQRGEMLQKSRASVRAAEAKWREEMEREKAVFFEEMRGRAATEILAIARQALGGLASAEVERSAIQAFLRQLQSLDPAALRLLCAGELAVATPDELPDETKREIQAAIEQRLGAPVAVRFEQAPAMSWGIELRGGGQRIGWTPDGYLDSLEEKLKDAFDRGVSTGCAVAA